MSASDHNVIRLKLINWRLAYQKDGNGIRYFSNCAATAMSLWLEEQNALRAKMGMAGRVAPTALSVSSPLLMAALEFLVDELDCPIDSQYTATDFLDHFAKKVKSRYDSEYIGPVRNTIKPVRDALLSLGLLT